MGFSLPLKGGFSIFARGFDARLHIALPCQEIPAIN